MFFGSREASNMVRKIFVTGATSGIGEAIAQAFQAEGAQVIATGATDLEVQNALKKPSNAGIDFRVLDVRDLSAVQALVGALSELDVVVNKDVWASWSANDRAIVSQAAIDAGKEQIAIARKGLAEPGQPLLKDIEALGVTVTKLSPAERDAFVKATRPVYEKWKNQIGEGLVSAAEKAVAAR